MKIKNFIFGKKPGAKTTKEQLQNPYVKGAEGRKEWNDRYINMGEAVKKWQFAFFVAVGLVFIQTLLIAKIASASKIKPYVVETSQGVPYAIKPVVGISNQDKVLVNYAVNQFIINSKTIIADTAGLQAMLDKLYAYSAGKTMGFLQDYYAKNNPFELASKYSVSVNIVNSLPISDNTWQITWDEVKHNNIDGSVISTTRWLGQVTYQIGEVNPETINNNPFGIYITEITWSQNQ